MINNWNPISDLGTTLRRIERTQCLRDLRSQGERVMTVTLTTDEVVEGTAHEVVSRLSVRRGIYVSPKGLSREDAGALRAAAQIAGWTGCQPV